MSKNTGGPAFPGENCLYNKGMTLRDYFAAKAMQGWLGSRPTLIDELRVAAAAYILADAMIAEREK